MSRFLVPNLIAAAVFVGGIFPNQACPQPVVYTSTDQEYAEVVLKEAEAAIAQKVTAVFDAEASKTVGLERRLVAEKSKPKADVFWNSEFLRTHRLDKKRLLAPTFVDKSFKLPASVVTPNSVGFGIRGRVLAVHTPSVPETDRPKRIKDLADPLRKSEVACSRPQFGTTRSATRLSTTHAGEGRPLFQVPA